MTVKDILLKQMKECGADGLYNSNGECGCGIDDLVPCENWCLDCELAKKVGDEYAPIEVPMPRLEYMGTMTDNDIRSTLKWLRSKTEFCTNDILPEYDYIIGGLYNILSSKDEVTLHWPRNPIAWNAFNLVCADWLYAIPNRSIGIFYPPRLRLYFPAKPIEYNGSFLYYLPAEEGKGGRFDHVFLLDGCHEFAFIARQMPASVTLVISDEPPIAI